MLLSGRQRIAPIRRDYNRWVANQTLEDFALRFTAKSARRWSTLRVAQTAIGAVSFLALEAIGGTVTLTAGFETAVAAIAAVGFLIILTSLPISYHAARAGLDIDLLTRGAGFGYIGSTITSLIYATFTFIFFAIEAAIMATALELCFGLPLPLGYVVSSIVVIPLVMFGVTAISRFQIWTQPLWIVLNLLPFAFILTQDPGIVHQWIAFPGLDASGSTAGFDLIAFGAASGVLFSLIAQVGEQVDFLRFLPAREEGKARWYAAMLSAGPGWMVPGGLKIIAGSFLACLALRSGVAVEDAADPTHMYRTAFSYVLPSPTAAIALTGVFVIVSQLKINVTNSYAGSIAWSNFFSRLTHSHPGRVVWLVFNVGIALLLMELGIYKTLERTLALYSIVAVSWVGAVVGDLVVAKPLGLSPAHIEFKRAHLYDINPVGVGAMALAIVAGTLSLFGAFGATFAAFASYLSLGTAFVAAPVIAALTGGRYYLARKPRRDWNVASEKRCIVCENVFEAEDMAYCPAYSGAICSLCCSLDARCHDLCKPHGRIGTQTMFVAEKVFPAWAVAGLQSNFGRFLGVLTLLGVIIGLILGFVYLEAAAAAPTHADLIFRTLWAAFFVLLIVAGITAWLLVLAQTSRRIAQAESNRQTTLLLQEIAAHKRTDAALQRAKEAAESANLAKSRYVVGISHEFRTPLNAIMGYAQLLARDPAMPAPRANGVRTILRSAEHLASLIEGLLDISKIEAGRLQVHRNPVRLRDFLTQIVEMFRIQADTKKLAFEFRLPKRLPDVIYTDEKRLRQILINLLSNAIKFTENGSVSLAIEYRSQITDFIVSDTGPGIDDTDAKRIFEPFERGESAAVMATPGLGLGLTLTRLMTEILGGEINLESTLGRGSTFRVRLLTFEATQAMPEPEPARPIAGYEGRPRSVLVVDDDAAQRDLIREILSPLGFVVLSAGDAASCLTLAQEIRPDLFILDLAMPGVGGLELARRLRESEHGEAAILMLSANIGEVAAVGREDAPYDATMGKPFELGQFLICVERLLDIEWVEEQAVTPVSDSSSGENPSPHHVRELLRLGRIGYVRGIDAKLIEIEAIGREHQPFVDEARALIRAYDFPRYLALLESIGSHE